MSPGRIAAMASLVLAVAIVAVIVQRSMPHTYELHASFDDVRGLIAGGDVRAGAVPVGKVTKVEIGPGDRPLVTMAVDDDVALHRGATADIRLASNVGAVNRVVELTEGDTAAPRLDDGATLTTRQTDQPVNFDEAADTLTPAMRRRLGLLLGGVDASLRGRGADVDRLLRHSTPALGNTADLLDEVGRDGAALRTLVADGDRVASTLASRPESLAGAADRVAGLLHATAARQGELRASVRELGPALVAGRRTLETLAAATPQLRRLARGLDPVATALAPVARDLPGVTAAAGPLLAQTRRLVQRGPAQLRALRPIARAAMPVAAKLEPVARKALPLAQVLQVYVPETVGAFQNFGATAGAYDANGHVMNVAADVVNVLPDSVLTGGELGPADCDKSSPSGLSTGLLRKPFIRVPGVNECQPWTDLPPGIVTPAKGG